MIPFYKWDPDIPFLLDMMGQVVTIGAHPSNGPFLLNVKKIGRLKIVIE